MKSKPIKSWVLLKMAPGRTEWEKKNAGTIQAWRDYGTAWGSPAYTVLGYFDGSHRDAVRYGKTLAKQS